MNSCADAEELCELGDISGVMASKRSERHTIRGVQIQAGAYICICLR